MIDTPIGNMTINEGDEVSFTGTGVDPNGNTLSYLWEFGVGSGIANSTQEDPGLVQFNNPGTYTVAFTVIDSSGLYDSTPDTRIITVNGIPSITAPADVSVEATGQQTSVDIGTATAVDLEDGPLPVSNDAPATFPVGTGSGYVDGNRCSRQHSVQQLKT